MKTFYRLQLIRPFASSFPTTEVEITVSLGPHCAYFRMRTLKPQVAKVSTVCVEKTFKLVAQHLVVVT